MGISPIVSGNLLPCLPTAFPRRKVSPPDGDGEQSDRHKFKTGALSADQELGALDIMMKGRAVAGLIHDEGNGHTYDPRTSGSRLNGSARLALMN
jgi:hypothetical protein